MLCEISFICKLFNCVLSVAIVTKIKKTTDKITKEKQIWLDAIKGISDWLYLKPLTRSSHEIDICCCCRLCPDVSPCIRQHGFGQEKRLHGLPCG
jgi:hypothetical protein